MAAGWDARHAWFEEVAGPVTLRMLERLAPAHGEIILDVAAGTGSAGLAAAALVGSSGRVIISDFAQPMVDAAARRATGLGLSNVECRVLDGERMEIADAAVDGVLCRWGYMLMADPATALSETRRVLKQGGRVAAAVFAGPAENPWATVPARVLQDLGHMPPPPPDAPGILALANRDRLRVLISDAGFTPPSLEDVAFTWRFANMDDYWQFLTEAAGGIAGVLNRLDPSQRGRVREEIDRRLGRPSAVELSAVSIVFSAS